MPSSQQLLAGVDRYLDAVPRVASRVELVGPFTLFIGTGPWRYYARPTPGRGREITAASVATVIARQRELGEPETIEWVHEAAPGLLEAARAAGLRAHLLPLMALGSATPVAEVEGVTVRVLTPDDDALEPTLAAVEAGFNAPGTAVGPDDIAERDGLLASVAERVVFARERIRAGDLVVVAALTAAVRARGVRIVILSADGEDVARVYTRAGFERVGSVGEAG